jgi:hypothetical protein
MLKAEFFGSRPRFQERRRNTFTPRTCERRRTLCATQ